MDVSKEEFRLLLSISEGMSTLDQAEIFTGFERDRLMEIATELEKLLLIRINKKGKHINNWEFELDESSNELFGRHKEWM